MSTASVAALLGAMLAVAIVPGPGDWLVIGRSIGHGFLHGLLVTIGIIAADYVFIVCAIYSLGWLAEQLDALFRIVELACGLCLLALGIGTWRTRAEAAAGPAPRAGSASASASLVSGFLLTFGDPKAILFYVGLLPAFIDPATATWREALIVMLAATVTVAGIKLSYTGLAGRARAWATDARLRRRLGASAGAVLAAIGAWLIARAALQLAA